MQIARFAADEGTSPVTIVILLPAIILFIELIVGAGRLRAVQADLNTAARDGARSAAMAQSPGEIQSRLQEIADTAFVGDSSLCADPIAGYGPTNNVEPGGVVSVEVTCSVDFGLAGGLIFARPIKLSGSAVEPLNPFRSYG